MNARCPDTVLANAITAPACLSTLAPMSNNRGMKTLTVRLPELLAEQLDAESRERRISKSDIVRQRLQADAGTARHRSSSLAGIADLIGSVEGLPPDLSSRRKAYLEAKGGGRKHSR